jgi:thiamine biosynthesis lipoprotein
MIAETVRHPFRAMGTEVVLISDTGAGPGAFARAAAKVERVFAREEARFSRFRGDSELSAVNARAGSPTRVSPAFARLLAFALDAARRTRGRFDPTVLDAVIAAGYDRDFDEVLAGARVALRPGRPSGRWDHIALHDDEVLLPSEVGLDLGGVAKGWTVDLAAADALAAGLSWAVVNAGGDLRVAGEPPATGIGVGVDDPEASGDEIARLVVGAGAIATSSVTRRAWGPGLHHMIDPATGVPADSGILQATVWAPTCAEAEVLAKEALLDGEASLERIGAVLVTAGGRIVTNLEGAMEEAA